MTSRLLLVRHGRSAHNHDGSWIDAEAARRFEAAYDAASIRDDDVPPAELVAVAKNAERFVCSDLTRAIASVERLAPGREPAISPLLRELWFDLPSWAPRLPVNVWDVAHYAVWTYRLATRAENSETRRARDAAVWLESHALPFNTTIVITHGGFRRLLAFELERSGWKPDGGRRLYHNWSVWGLTKEPTA
ncbi:MAG TPA: histidine phosphatase family protein [Gemmatimonadaceae bacterium]